MGIMLCIQSVPLNLVYRISKRKSNQNQGMQLGKARVYEGYTAWIWALFLTQLNEIAKKSILHIFYHIFHGKLN